MSGFSIEMAAEEIVDHRTKRYFAEVQGCYHAGYYRSAIVMLWSVVVTDIMFKLDQLASAHNDGKAQTILNDIGNIRKGNPKSPEWEIELVNKVAAQTDLIDQSELVLLQNLQTHRHLSAHPVMTNQDVLYSPNKETARAHIRNTLEAVLTKPPIMSRKVFNAFLEDVEQLAKLQPDTDAIRKFLDAKYFQFFSPATFAQVFRSLWRVTFRSTDPRCTANREINLKTLVVLFATKREEFFTTIKQDRAWFSDISVTDIPLEAFVDFCQEYPQIFPVLSDAAKQPVENYAKLDLSNFLKCTFLNDSAESHAEAVLKRLEAGDEVKPAALSAYCQRLPNGAKRKALARFGITYYFRSDSFDTADQRFAGFISPFISGYEVDDFIAFLEGCKTCERGQATGRNRAKRDHAIIRQAIEERFAGEITIDNYPDFVQSVGKA